MFLKFNLIVFSPFYLRSNSVLGTLHHFFINLQSVRCTDGRAVRAVPAFLTILFFLFMGKQLGVIQFSGKLDNVVGAKKSAIQKSNIVRIHRETISNPKSTGQSLRRMRLLPAVNFYRALQPVLNHAFQGTPYKAPSHSEFMSNALKNDIYPFVPRGESNPIPGPYLISKGSLPSYLVTFGAQTSAQFGSTMFLSEIAVSETLGKFTTDLLAANPALQNGDQLTFIACYTDNANVYNSNLSWVKAAIVLDQNSTQLLSDAQSKERVTFAAEGGRLAIKFNGFEEIAAYVCAAAIIVSRPSATPGAAWQRSTTSMQVEPSTLAFVRSQEKFEFALSTYTTAQNVAIASDWYLNQTKSAFRKNDTFLYAAEHGGIPNALFISEGGVSSLVLNDNDTIYVFDGNSASATNVTADTAEGAFTYIGYVKNIFPSLEVSSVFNIDRLFWRSNSDNTYYLLYTKQGIVHLRVEGEEAEKYIRASKNNVSNVTVSSITTPSEVVINATFADNVYSFEYGGVAYKINSVLHTISPSITQILA